MDENTKREYLQIVNKGKLEDIKNIHNILFPNRIVDWNCGLCLNNAIQKIKKELNK